MKMVYFRLIILFVFIFERYAETLQLIEEYF